MKSTMLLLFSILLAGCVSGPTENPAAKVNMMQLNAVKAAHKDQLYLFYQTWHNTPFRLGGQSKKGVDCSAFVQIAFNEVFHHPIPRTTKTQSNVGVWISYEQRQFGDLVFFKTGYGVRHVGIYVGDNSFMHASTSHGVMISRLDSPYWADAYWQIRRIL
ncbi:NlpC/P60 family protein [Vibrio gallicus]|uniref:NlpC/P60 family protein n=1 Tax=Vibrio gallicus TaxID=190897 RepID=UPI0021C412DC|nr:NlpC/P60 family protein [Vibrio gallicus]